MRLRAILHSSGAVKHILVLKGLSYGLTESAVEAAKQLKFKPATIRGKEVAQAIALEYNFQTF